MSRSSDIRNYTLYTLKLEGGKYYVGITSRRNPQQRIAEHKKGIYGARWTKRYRPTETLEIIPLGRITKTAAEAQEQKRTLQYMKKYGWRNVRGGSLSYSGRYVKIGTWFWRDYDWENLVVVLVLMAALAFLLLEVR